MTPLFGTQEAGATYVDRPGAYALILDDAGLMPIVRLRGGRHFLPGGGIEPGESVIDCLAREVAEELAWGILIGEELARATQYALSERFGHVAVQAHYFRGTLTDPLPGTPEHDCLWMTPSAAVPLMAREADRWAIAHFMLDGVRP